MAGRGRRAGIPGEGQRTWQAVPVTERAKLYIFASLPMVTTPGMTMLMPDPALYRMILQSVSLRLCRGSLTLRRSLLSWESNAVSKVKADPDRSMPMRWVKSTRAVRVSGRMIVSCWLTGFTERGPKDKAVIFHDGQFFVASADASALFFTTVFEPSPWSTEVSS
jgi:hypothetical protein